MPVKLACDIEKTRTLWNALANSDTSRVDETGSLHLNGLCQLVEAKSAALIGLVRMDSPSLNNLLNGWRLRLVHHLNPVPELLQASRIQRRLIPLRLGNAN